VWTDRPAGWWAQDVARPEGSDPVPATLDWNAWLGVAPERPYKRDTYHPFSWRGFVDFGTGAQGDMACHLVDPALWFLELGPPRSVRSEGPPDNGETYPAWTTVHTTFAPTRWTIEAPVTVTWYDGGRRAPVELLERYGAGPDVWSNACLFVGERGALLTSPYAAARVLPEERYPSVARFELEERNHWHEWVDACAGIGTPSAPFSYAGPLTEVALLGNAALRFPGEELAWDATKLRFPERREANAGVTKRYRDGWGPKGLA
jgi:predicted dehydrogenase